MSDRTTNAPDTATIAGMVAIERLRRENVRLREALRDLIEESAPLLPNGSYELKQAKAALQEAEG